MNPKQRAILVAVVLVSLICGTMLLAVPYVGIFFMAMAVGGFMWLGASLLKEPGQKRYKDPYDLNLLKEIHERASWEDAYSHKIPEDADVICPHCGHLYGSKLKVCPNCKRMP